MNRSVIALPKPCAPPVTTAVRPSRSITFDMGGFSDVEDRGLGDLISQMARVGSAGSGLQSLQGSNADAPKNRPACQPSSSFAAQNCFSILTHVVVSRGPLRVIDPRTVWCGCGGAVRTRMCRTHIEYSKKSRIRCMVVK